MLSRALTKHLGLAILLITPLTLVVGQSKPTQYDVKAAYLYNFAKFVRWPTTSSPTFTLCVIGDNPFGDALERTIRGEKLNGLTVELKRVAGVPSGESCNMVFISESAKDRLPSLLAASAKQHALTVSDIPNFIEKGGMIGFVNENNRIRFEVSQVAAQQAGLTFNSELLKVAIRVKQGDNR